MTPAGPVRGTAVGFRGSLTLAWRRARVQPRREGMQPSCRGARRDRSAAPRACLHLAGRTGPGRADRVVMQRRVLGVRAAYPD